MLSVEVFANYVDGDRYVEFSLSGNNVVLKTGLLTKVEALDFIQQFIDCKDDVDSMPEKNPCAN